MQFDSSEVSISVEGAVLAGTLLTANLPKPQPTLVLVSGSGANDRDETVCGHTPLKTLAEFFANDGYNVLRWDDRGVGMSTGAVGAASFEDTVRDTAAWCLWLSSLPSVDSTRIIILGHSEGGLVAAAAGQIIRARAVVMLAGPAVEIEPLLHEQARVMSLEGGATEEQLTHERLMNEKVFEMARSDSDSLDVLRQLEEVIRSFLETWPGISPLSQDEVSQSAKLMASILGSTPYRSFLKQNPAEIIRSFEGNLLAVYGGNDCQVSGATNRDAFKRITRGRSGAESKLFPVHNHLFQVAETSSISEYERGPTAPDVKVMQEIRSWLRVAVDLP